MHGQRCLALSVTAGKEQEPGDFTSQILCSYTDEVASVDLSSYLNMVASVDPCSYSNTVAGVTHVPAESRGPLHSPTDDGLGYLRRKNLMLPGCQSEKNILEEAPEAGHEDTNAMVIPGSHQSNRLPEN